MDDNSVVVVKLSDGTLVQLLSNKPIPRGIVVASNVGRIFVISNLNYQLYIIDSTSLAQNGIAGTGNAPDCVSWDPTDKIAGVSDQGDGVVSLITGSGSGARTQVTLSAVETGNVIYDASRGRFWVRPSTRTSRSVGVDRPPEGHSGEAHRLAGMPRGAWFATASG
jgi:DNA-binding beta-propeller fold protein YncE